MIAGSLINMKWCRMKTDEVPGRDPKGLHANAAGDKVYKRYAAKV